MTSLGFNPSPIGLYSKEFIGFPWPCQEFRRRSFPEIQEASGPMVDFSKKGVKLKYLRRFIFQGDHG